MWINFVPIVRRKRSVGTWKVRPEGMYRKSSRISILKDTDVVHVRLPTIHCYQYVIMNKTDMLSILPFLDS